MYEESNPTEFTRECQEMIKAPDDDKGWTESAIYTIWLEVKLEQACCIINQLQTNKRQECKLRYKCQCGHFFNEPCVVDPYGSSISPRCPECNSKVFVEY